MKVSAIITTRNRRELVIRAINSVFSQTYPNIECIVVDDAGTDNTRDYIAKYIDMKRLSYIYIPKEESKGGNHARNVGILASSGELVAFLDDDDEWLPDKTKKQVNAMMENPEAGFVYCGAIRENNLDPASRYSFPIDEDHNKDGDLSREVLIHIITTTSAIMVRRNLLNEIGLFDEELKYWQEYELCIRLLQKTKAKCVRENLILYRIISGDKNRLSNKIEGWEKAVAYIEKKHSNLFETLSPEEKALRQVFVCIDGFGRGKGAGSKKTMLRYAWKTLSNPQMRVEAYRKFRNRIHVSRSNN